MGVADVLSNSSRDMILQTSRPMDGTLLAVTGRRTPRQFNRSTEKLRARRVVARSTSRRRHDPDHSENCAYRASGHRFLRRKRSSCLASYSVGMRHAHETVISSYVPRLPAHHWALLAPFVLERVRRYETTSPEATRFALMHLTNFADWVVLTRIRKLGDDAFDTAVIDAYIQFRLAEVKPNVALRERKILRSLGSLTNTPGRWGARTTASAVVRPYSLAAQSDAGTWATQQHTAAALRDCPALVGMGFGCGLTSREMLSVRVSDFNDGAMRVAGPRERIVPVAPQWRELLERSLRNAQGSELLIAPNAPSRAAALIYDRRYKSLGGVGPAPQRMRNTWLADRINEGLDADTLLTLSGLTAIDRLWAVLPFTDPERRHPSLVSRTPRVVVD